MKKNKLEVTEKVLLRFIDFLDQHNFFSFTFLILCGMAVGIAYANRIAIIIEAFR